MPADADDQLRAVVADLAAANAWAGIFFVEEGELVLGPQAGEPDEERRVRVPVLWQGDRIAELAVDGEPDPAELERIASEISGLCLVGWDTGGEEWHP